MRFPAVLLFAFLTWTMPLTEITGDPPRCVSVTTTELFHGCLHRRDAKSPCWQKGYGTNPTENLSPFHLGKEKPEGMNRSALFGHALSRSALQFRDRSTLTAPR